MFRSKFSIHELFRQVIPSSCPVEFNFHCHTTISDGSLDPIALFSQASSLGIKHLSVTDHHSVNAHYIIRDWLNDRSNQNSNYPTVWTGIEISCILKKCLVHVLGYDFTLGHHSMKPYINGDAPIGQFINAQVVIDSIHNAGGLAILAHPARYRTDYRTLISAGRDLGLDGAEAWYDYEYKEQWVPSPFICEEVDLLLKSLNMYSTCGTDTHGFSLTSR